MPVDEAARPLAGLMERYQPDVVVTYDDFGFYGHPDHIQAHRITLAALDMTGLPAKLYCPTVRRSALPLFAERMEQAGLEPPSFDVDRFGSPDEDMAASIDCREQATAKLDALAAHASQQDNIFFLRIPLADFTEMFGREEFIRLRDPTNSPTPEARPVHGPARHLSGLLPELAGRRRAGSRGPRPEQDKPGVHRRATTNCPCAAADYVR